MKDLLFKLKLLRTTNENWVSKILKKRIYTPVYIAIFISLFILTYNVYTSYSKSLVYEKRKEKILGKINKENKKLKNLLKRIDNQSKKISYLKGMSLNDKRPILLLNKVCNLLKDKEVIGSFYIKKRRSTKFANVLNIEIEISYGDKDLLFLVTKIVLDKVFYLKSIEQTKNGLKCELFKPSK